MSKIILAHDIRLPVDIVTESIAILAIKRAGKSTTARRLVEQLFAANQQCVVVDPKGDWWGLLYGKDGKSPGLPFVVLGGEHGHIPLASGTGPQALEKNGELIARLAVVERVSMVIDLSSFRKHEATRFMTFFMETLYRLKAQDAYRTPLMLAIDEADAIAPQRPIKSEGNLEGRMLGAAEDIVRRGGQRGIGVTLITQRAAVLNKNVLTQCGMLFALRTVASQDIGAIDDWVTEVHAVKEQRDLCIGSLQGLETGEGWIWSTSFPPPGGIFKRSKFLMPDTFDSSATPKVGQSRVIPKNAADVDLKAFERDMAATIEKARADDPRELRRRIHELEKQKPAAVKVDPAAAQREKKLRHELEEQLAKFKGLEKYAAELAGRLIQIGKLTNIATDKKFVFRATVPIPEIRKTVDQLLGDVPPARATRPTPALKEPKAIPGARDASAPGLSKMEQSMLIALAQHPDGLSKAQVLLHTSYSASGSTSTAFGELHRNGWIESPQQNFVKITEPGLEALGVYEPLPQGEELRTWLLTGDKLGAMEKKMLRILFDVYPHAIGKGDVLERAGYSASGSTSTAFGRLVRYGYAVSAGANQLKAGEELFEESP